MPERGFGASASENDRSVNGNPAGKAYLDPSADSGSPASGGRPSTDMTAPRGPR